MSFLCCYFQVFGIIHYAKVFIPCVTQQSRPNPAR